MEYIMKNNLKSMTLLICSSLLFFFTTSGFVQTKSIEATIDANETHTPISKYVYGQFIEDIGDIFNNDIWAEMIDGRKFYAPANRWIAIGSMDAITFDSSHVFTGKHSPRISTSESEARGFWQDELALVEEKEYTGRVVLAGVGEVSVQATLVWGDESDERETVEIEDLSKENTLGAALDCRWSYDEEFSTLNINNNKFILDNAWDREVSPRVTTITYTGLTSSGRSVWGKKVGE